MPTPSLLIVPSRWKTGNPGKLYSQIPTNGNGDFNVTGVITGATNAGTRVNNLGYIEPITTSGTPRLDYYTSSGLPGCPALLVEPSGTNLALYSEQFNNAAWSKNATTVSGNIATSPDGNTNADKIQETNSTDAHYISQGGYMGSSGTYTASVYLKAVERTWGWVYIYNGTEPGGAAAFFNLSAGTIGTVNPAITATITNAGNGWYRCIITRTIAGNALADWGFGTSTGDGNISFTGTAGSGILAWGAQVETGSVATSYIPTTTGTVTRNAEVITASGAVSGSIGQTEGVLYCEFEFPNSDKGDVILIRSTDNRNFVEFISAGTTAQRARIRASAGSYINIFPTAPNMAINTRHKIAIAYKTGNSALYINGVLQSNIADSFTFDTAFNDVVLGPNALGPNPGIGRRVLKIFAAALYNTRLSNADLMLLTMPGNNTYLPQAVWDNYLSRPGNSEVPDCLYTRHADLLDV